MQFFTGVFYNRWWFGLLPGWTTAGTVVLPGSRCVMKKNLIVVCGVVLLSACTWVKVSPKGETVRLVQSQRAVESCKRIGKVNAKVVSRVVIERDEEKVATELTNLARNEAGMLGGDTVVPISEIYDGRRVFAVYQCFQSGRNN